MQILTSFLPLAVYFTADLLNPFDEKTLFPAYILKYDLNMRKAHRELLESSKSPKKNSENQKRLSRLGLHHGAGRHTPSVAVKHNGIKPRLSPLPEIPRKPNSQGSSNAGE